MEEINVKMLGEFSVEYGGRPISFGRAGARKTGQLFQLLMLSSGHRVSKEQIAECLYRDNDRKNGSINNALYRLRGLFREAGLLEEAILLEDGYCFWNPELPVHVDALEFEKKLEESCMTDRNRGGGANRSALQRLASLPGRAASRQRHGGVGHSLQYALQEALS